LSQANLRKYPRANFEFALEYTVGTQTFRTRATSLGGGGLLLKEQQGLSLGTEISVRFRPAKHLPIVQAKSKVNYHIPGRGTGIEFTEIRPEHRQILLRLIHHKTDNKRRSPRAPLPTQIECDECMSLAYSRNLSAGGMFIETASPLPINAELSLRFSLNDNGPVVEARAKVTYQVAKMGMGVFFTDLSPEDRKRIEVYVTQNRIPPPSAAEEVGRTT
jgi:c-di-GMP-binding flagellar brake protein YcgR